MFDVKYGDDPFPDKIKIKKSICLNQYHATGLFLYPRGFLMFSEGIERDRGMKWVKPFLANVSDTPENTRMVRNGLSMFTYKKQK